MAIMSPEELEKVKQKEIEELREMGVDILLMNPPYDSQDVTGLDTQFTTTANEISDTTLAIYPATKWTSSN